jgi:hypothetical protein
MDTTVQDELVGLLCSTISVNEMLATQLAELLSGDASRDPLVVEGYCARLARTLATVPRPDLDDAALVVGAAVTLDDAGWHDAAMWLRARLAPQETVMNTTTEQLYRCPDTPGEIMGCGYTFAAVPDMDGTVDCPNCGIFFLGADNLVPQPSVRPQPGAEGHRDDEAGTVGGRPS